MRVGIPLKTPFLMGLTPHAEGRFRYVGTKPRLPGDQWNCVEE
jgi:hypothetical protein